MLLLCMYFLFALFLRATAGNGDINASNKIHFNICCQFGLFLGFLMLYYIYHTDYTKEYNVMGWVQKDTAEFINSPSGCKFIIDPSCISTVKFSPYRHAIDQI